MRIALLALLVALAGCASTADRQKDWAAYAQGQCAKLAGADHEKCVVDVVARCNSDHEINGAMQKGCRP